MWSEIRAMLVYCALGGLRALHALRVHHAVAVTASLRSLAVMLPAVASARHQKWRTNIPYRRGRGCGVLHPPCKGTGVAARGGNGGDACLQVLHGCRVPLTASLHVPPVGSAPNIPLLEHEAMASYIPPQKGRESPYVGSGH